MWTALLKCRPTYVYPNSAGYCISKNPILKRFPLLVYILLSRYQEIVFHYAYILFSPRECASIVTNTYVLTNSSTDYQREAYQYMGVFSKSRIQIKTTPTPTPANGPRSTTVIHKSNRSELEYQQVVLEPKRRRDQLETISSFWFRYQLLFIRYIVDIKINKVAV